jgi:alpha-tubulin suppressor-like RCC1 family protein
MTRFISQLAKLLSVLILCAVLDAPATMASPIVLSFGSNFYGATGLGTTSGNTGLATPIDMSKLGSRTITQVAAGTDYSLLLADDGAVFSFGANTYGKTGLGTNVGGTVVATPIDASNLGGRKIIQVSAGRDHSLLLAEDGSVFSFGANYINQIGRLTDSGDTLVATPIDASKFGGRKIAQVSAGGYHSLLLADDGNVFAFGMNDFKQLGIPYVINVPIATPIDASNLGKIVQIAAGHEHSLLLAEDGTVYSFGFNLYGQGGIGTDFDVIHWATPIDAALLGGRKIVQVAAGDFYNLLLAEDGTVFSFGMNFDGRTGLGKDDFNTLSATPIDASNLGGREITQMSAGSHSLLLAEDGTVFSFGSNGAGQTGRGKFAGSTLVATPIETANRNLGVTHIAAGSGHSLLIAMVPEPGTLALPGLGLLGVVSRVRRRR